MWYWFYKYIGIGFVRRRIAKIAARAEGGEAFSPTLRRIYREFYDIEVGYGTYGGCFDLSRIPAGVRFGNYCSVASEVRIFRANHPTDRFTMHPLLYNPSMGYVSEDKLSRPHLEIGHDVWIGANAIILPGVMSVGSGSVIGAGSVVTKDVEPYTIVAGNPARVIGRRFDAEAIARLEATRWWELSKDELIGQIGRLSSLVKSEG